MDASERDPWSVEVSRSKVHVVSVPSMGPEFDSGTLCALRSRLNCSTGPEVHVRSMKAKRMETQCRTRTSFACEPKIRRRRPSLVCPIWRQRTMSVSKREWTNGPYKQGGDRFWFPRSMPRHLQWWQSAMKEAASHSGARGGAQSKGFRHREFGRWAV